MDIAALVVSGKELKQSSVLLLRKPGNDIGCSWPIGMQTHMLAHFQNFWLQSAVNFVVPLVISEAALLYGFSLGF